MAKLWCSRFIQDERAQDLVEYALLLALVALGSVFALQSLGPVVSAKYATAATELSTDGVGGGSGSGNAGGGNSGTGNNGNNGNGNNGNANNGNGNNGNNGNGNNGHAGS